MTLAISPSHFPNEVSVWSVEVKDSFLVASSKMKETRERNVASLIGYKCGTRLCESWLTPKSSVN